MPRSTLPSQLKKLETQNVLLTQTTEEEIWDGLKLRHGIFIARKDYFIKKLSEYTSMFLDGNVYANADMNKPLERKYKDDSFTWLTKDEQDEYQTFFKLRHDFEICNKTMNWNEKPDFEDMLWELNKFQMFASTSLNDVEMLEQHQFKLFCTRKRIIAMEKLNTDKVLNPHKYHTPIHAWVQLFKDHPDAWNWKNGSEQIKYNESLQCLKCQEFEVERTQIKTDIEEIKELVQEIKKTETYTCEDCKFETQSKTLHNMHIHSTEHRKVLKLKEWFCEKCNSQSRTQTEWDNHIQTNKHLNKSDSNEYVCEKCEYKTKLKHLYDQHCNTKKHLSACS